MFTWLPSGKKTATVLHNRKTAHSFISMRFLLLVLSFFFYIESSAQNLVANGSMEDENICTEFIKNCAPEAWIVSSLQSNFYFDDAANAYHGQHFVGLVAGGNGRYGSRNFIRSQLLCGLRKGSVYKVEFYMRNGSAGPDSGGIYFSKDDLLYRKWGTNDITPQIWLGDQFEPTEKNQWKRFSSLYTASGDEAFINIALFKKVRPERISRLASNPEYNFYIDFVSVVPINTAEKWCTEAAVSKEALYDENERHSLLEKKIYPRQRKPPQEIVLPKTIIQKIDTLILPDVLFATNSYALTKGAMALLDSFVAAINNVGVDSIIVEGHTDNKGSKTLNEKLSQNRAASVLQQLEQTILKEVPLYKKGWADEKPRSTNNTPAGRQKNRRVEIFIYKRD